MTGWQSPGNRPPDQRNILIDTFLQQSRNNKNKKNFSNNNPDLRNLLRRNSESPENEVDISGPYDFRQLLRPAKHLPTESLRKRKGAVSMELPTPEPVVPGDTPSKRRAHKY